MAYIHANELIDGFREFQRSNDMSDERKGWIHIGQAGDYPPPVGTEVLLKWERDGKIKHSIAEFSFGVWHTPGEGCINPIAFMVIPDYTEDM